LSHLVILKEKMVLFEALYNS